MEKIIKYRLAILIGSIFFLAGLTIGLGYNYLSKNDTGKVIREHSSEFKFIDPLLLTSVGGEENLGEYKNIKKVVDNQLNEFKSEGKLNDAPVYFKDLKTDNWFGINVDAKYSPASMLKVAVLLSYLRASESNPSLLDQNVYVAKDGVDASEDQNYKPEHPVQVGRTYNARQLLWLMIVESDNNAMSLLEQLIGQDQVNKIYKDLLITEDAQAGDINDLDFMSPRQYSRFFRLLYNSTYLSHRASEEALQLLSKTTFTKGLVSGVPNDVVVSHKFGERKIINGSGDKSSIIYELHDCGIIYAPTHPYLLCIMTRGESFADLEKVISSISKTVWDLK